MLRVEDRSRRALASAHWPQHSRRISLLGLDSRAIERVRLGECQPEGPLVVPLEPGMADELAREPDRAEPLVVEVIGQSRRGQRPELSQRRGQAIRVQVAEHDGESVAAEMLWAIGVRERTDRLEVITAIVYREFWSISDREVLDRDRVPILEPAETDATARQVPPPADQLDGLDGSQPALGQPVEGVPTL